MQWPAAEVGTSDVEPQAQQVVVGRGQADDGGAGQGAGLFAAVTRRIEKRFFCQDGLQKSDPPEGRAGFQARGWLCTENVRKMAGR